MTPQGDGHDPRPQFDPHAFVRSSDTLYSLSKEGKGTAGPLVTALTAATVEAAEEYATTLPGGRLQTPMLGILDEAANVCRWHDLPDLYSHYGSRGIVLMTILQSWSQGVQVWGRDGMRKLWSASNVAIYGGGVKEPEFLNELSQMIGDYDRRTTSTSVGRGTRSTSHGVQRERTLDVADLGSLPRGRAVVLASGAPATLVETVPWMNGPHADALRASIAAHDPLKTSAPAPAWVAQAQTERTNDE
ncbi:type IV secretory system conjugative DNA transfer family protein [Microbacterium sp. LMI1-1-1.1]|uniref:type IV secretory system conjugative DNA transfer family protein n=1 Tax=Microbacterium sp. LMI1-1-1.1 TaxID=3135223 RepID=UPI0034679967